MAILLQHVSFLERSWLTLRNHTTTLGHTTKERSWGGWGGWEGEGGGGEEGDSDVGTRGGGALISVVPEKNT